MQTTRRNFFRDSLSAGAAVGLAASGAGAIEPIQRSGRPLIRLSLAAYSFRQLLDLRRKPQPTMSLDDFIEMAASLPLDAVELTAYYFAQTTPRYLAQAQGPLHAAGVGH